MEFTKIADLLSQPEVSLPTSLVPASFTPTATFSIQFKDHSVEYGNKLTPTEAAGEFELKISSGDSTGLFTVIGLDPDAPSRVNPIAGPWLHSIQTSLSFAGASGVGVPQHDAEGLALVPWTGPAPPPDTGLHRYTFLLYRQPSIDLHPLSKHASPKSTSRFDRRNFDCEGFVSSNELELVGVNWFFCENQGVAKA